MNHIEREITNLNELLAMHRRRLQILQMQRATLGLSTPPHIFIEIEEITKQVEELEERLARLKNQFNVPVPKHPLPPAGTPQNLNLSFHAVGEKHYRLSWFSPDASLTEDFTAPFSAHEIEKIHHLFEIGKLTGASVADALQKFGTELFNALPQHLRERYRVMIERDFVRWRLALGDPWLTSVPWEFLYDPLRHEFIAKSFRATLVRYAELGYQPAVTAARPFKILAVAPAPNDFPELDVAHEREQLEKALSNLIQQSKVQIAWLESQTTKTIVSLEALQDALFQFQPQVLHFIGHGEFDTKRDTGQLWFERDVTRKGIPLPAAQLASMVNGSASVRLVFLNACKGATTGVTDPFGSIAAALSRQSVPAVIAMQFPVTDNAAMEFGRKVYQRLAEGAAVDVAVQQGRVHLSEVTGNTLEWGNPVLYLLPENGHIFLWN